MVKFRNKYWDLQISRNMSFWHDSMCTEGHFFHSEDYGVNCKLQMFAVVFDGTQTHIFEEIQNHDDYVRAVMEAVSTKNKLVDLREKYHQTSQQLISALELCLSDITFESWKHFSGEYARFTATLNLTAMLGREAAELLSKHLLRSKIAEDFDISQIIPVITFPDESTPLSDSQLEMLKLASKQEITDSELQNWLEKYRHIPVNFCEDPWTLKDAQNLLSDFRSSADSPELRIKKHKENLQKIKEKKSKILTAIGDHETKHLADTLSVGGYLNEFRKNIFSKVSLGYRPIFQQVAKRSGSNNWRDCFYLTAVEIGEIIRGQDLNISKIVEKRKVAGIYIHQDGEIEIFNPDNLSVFTSFINEVKGLEKVDQDLVHEVNGMIANGGKIQGTAKIIHSSKDFSKMNSGDVLIAQSTSVDFVPIMEKAAAFVTNEGGLTSHAAIVSREMGKPCIVGTKNATQVFKDGDLVEVDAEKGLVRKI